MASYVQGYLKERFEVSVDRNFECPICTNVLRDPVQCEHNQHYFCTPCITKHLANSKTCPVCMDKLTVDTLGKPPRILKEYLNGLKIKCVHAERGCADMVELGVLKTHVAECSYASVGCSREKCKAVVNRKDLEDHEINVCEYRILQCQDCEEEMTLKMLKKHACLTLAREVNKIKSELNEIKQEVTQMHGTQEELLKEMRKLTSESVLTMEPTTRWPSHFDTGGDVMVMGGYDGNLQVNSVETFSWVSKAWATDSQMQNPRASATVACTESQIIVAGGRYNGNLTDTIEYLVLDQEQSQWHLSQVKLPYKCCGHKSVIHNAHLLVFCGLMEEKHISNTVHEISLQPPFTTRLRCVLPQPLSFFGLQCVNNNILIIGGSTTGTTDGCVDSVFLYNVFRGNFKQLSPLPFAICDIATVSWSDNVIIIGGHNKRHETLNTVIMYNYKHEEWKMLPPLKHKRSSPAAVVSGNTLVVMGGQNKEGYLRSAEYFNFAHDRWQEFPPMIKPRSELTAVVKPAVCLEIFLG